MLFSIFTSSSIITDTKYLSAFFDIVPLTTFELVGIYPNSFNLTHFKVGILILCLSIFQSVLLFLGKYNLTSDLFFFLNLGNLDSPLKNLLYAVSALQIAFLRAFEPHKFIQLYSSKTFTSLFIYLSKLFALKVASFLEINPS